MIRFERRTITQRNKHLEHRALECHPVHNSGICVIAFEEDCSKVDAVCGSVIVIRDDMNKRCRVQNMEQLRVSRS